MILDDQPRPEGRQLLHHAWGHDPTLPEASAPWAWKTCLAMSNPIVLICSTDASFK
jgi:hypothetical protein